MMSCGFDIQTYKSFILSLWTYSRLSRYERHLLTPSRDNPPDVHGVIGQPNERRRYGVQHGLDAFATNGKVSNGVFHAGIPINISLF